MQIRGGGVSTFNESSPIKIVREAAWFLEEISGDIFGQIKSVNSKQLKQGVCICVCSVCADMYKNRRANFQQEPSFFSICQVCANTPIILKYLAGTS